ncbi:hypothetical protein IEO21_06526 [Rhodonia placenta]|uniref:Ribosomal protein/NADH dehydrogenase domain-containing protein n=1 Tax=Rhodonia placenta TaxID=104341 RepID=A0A8H7P032_9APHY|nr:hypothetical protein IEO21_06526 [Postia placenta]
MSFARALYPAIREIRIFCCQTNSASGGTREFLKSTHAIMKQHNPHLPIMVRQARGTPARAFVRYEKGDEKHVELDNLNQADVSSKIAQLLKKPS